VRKALLLAFNFEWLNKNLFHSAYERTQSYFGNTELEAPLIPSPEELTLAEGLGTDAQVLEAIPRSSDASNRQNLMAASRMLQQAGWRIIDGQLRNGNNQPFTFEILLADPSAARIGQQYIRDLARLGIVANVRIVDSAQHQQRANTFDYDMTLYYWGQSLSPGNEQMFYWSSTSADQQGTRNYMGVRDPALDSAIEALLHAVTREELVTATRLLDRILRAGTFVVPLYHQRADRVVYWNRIQPPAISPTMGYSLDSWYQTAN
jgi:ABC-type oligopeptide transport system substrate-binding subunit